MFRVLFVCLCLILAGCAEVREIAHLDKPAGEAPSK